MVFPGGDPHRGGQVDHRHRAQPLGGGSVAELALVVFAPATHGSRCRNGAGVGPAAGKVDGIGQVDHLCGDMAVVGGPVTQPAVAVVSPAPEGTIRSNSAYVGTTDYYFLVAPGAGINLVALMDHGLFPSWNPSPPSVCFLSMTPPVLEAGGLRGEPL